MAPPQEKSMLPVAGGALTLVSGVLAIGQGAIIAGGAGIPGVGLVPGFETALLLCGSIFIIFGLIAVLGGAMGVMRKMWGLALVGGIFGLLGVGFILGSVLGIVGLILTAISRKDFR